MKAQGENDLAANHSRDEFLLLLLGASGQDGRGAAASSADGHADAGKLFLHDVLLDTAAALPAIFLGPAYANPVTLGDLAHQFAVVLAAAALLGGFQFPQHFVGDVFGDESLDFLAEGFLFRSVCKVHQGLFTARMDGCRSAHQVKGMRLPCLNIAVAIFLRQPMSVK